MTANYVLLEKITVGAAGASSVTFSGIPQTGYTDLVIKASVRTSEAAGAVWDSLLLRFNGSSTGYSDRSLGGDGSTAFSFSNTFTNYIFCGDIANALVTSNTFSSVELTIPNYASSNNKSVSIDSVEENNATTAQTDLTAGLWSNTAAITSITFTPGAGPNFVANSTFYLYGVAKLGTTPVIVPYATGGDIIDTDGTYWYHTFLSSGTFTPQKSLSCDYLVVAGGGGGGSAYGGGGGAGGLRSTVTATGGGGSLESALSLASNTAYTVTVGAGGAGGLTGYNATTSPGTSGNNSVFSTITSTGGGGGGGGGGAAKTGGSGGGGVDGLSGAAGTANQGFAGTAGTNSNKYGSGGGGGAGSAATSAFTDQGGNGGSGVTTSISGSSITYGGGGGGGTFQGGTAGLGGSGGGGNAGSVVNFPNNGSPGTANRGGGGGGASASPYDKVGGNGGSGIVIVRYAV